MSAHKQRWVPPDDITDEEEERLCDALKHMTYLVRKVRLKGKLTPKMTARIAEAQAEIVEAAKRFVPPAIHAQQVAATEIVRAVARLSALRKEKENERA